jgi:hypothetical protein
MDVFNLVTDREAAALAVIRNPGLRIWQFNGMYPHDVTLDALASQLVNLEVIDQYAGSAPELFSLRRHIATKVELSVNRALLLDSNVSRYVRRYLDGKLKEPQRTDVCSLLRWAAEQHVNFHPGFSLMETFAGSSDPEFHGRELIKMGLLLSGMDQQQFLQNEQIVLGREGRAYLQAAFGSDDLDVAADLEIARLPRDMQQIVDRPYAALLKIALIEDTVPFERFQQRIEEFWTFLVDRIGGVLSFELVAAVLFFSGEIRKFIPLRTSAPLARRLFDVRSSAWDIHLARMAPAFISQGDECELTLPLIVTGDDRLKKIVRAQKLVGVLSREKQAPFPVVLADFDYLQNFTPKKWDPQWLQDRMAEREIPNSRTHVDIREVIEELEEHVRRRFGE